MKKFVVCVKSDYIRDSQIADLNKVNEDGMNDIDIYDDEYENIWNDHSSDGFVSIESAMTENEAISKVCDKYGYNKNVLNARLVSDNTDSILIVNHSEVDTIPYNVPYMIDRNNKIEPYIYVKTAIGILCGGIECNHHANVYDAASITLEPKGTDGEIIDITRAEISNINDKNADVKIYSFGNASDENPTFKTRISRDDIREAFDID